MLRSKPWHFRPTASYIAYSDSNGVHVRSIGNGDTRVLPDTKGMLVQYWAADATQFFAIHSGIECRHGASLRFAASAAGSQAGCMSTLKSEANSVIGSGHVSLRKALVAAQISLSLLLLLIGAGLFARSLYTLMQVSTGMRTERVLSFSIDPSLGGYSEQKARQLFLALQQALGAARETQAARHRRAVCWPVTSKCPPRAWKAIRLKRARI
jgi:hypothetical protein